jgi:UDP-N-acetyl-2-amino-2-deoxyglucuronate dehydrogenase
MATSLKKADELISACDENGVQLFVVKQNRLNSTLQLVKRAIDKGRFRKDLHGNRECPVDQAPILL